jgi:hypothetical protein
LQDPAKQDVLHRPDGSEAEIAWNPLLLDSHTRNQTEPHVCSQLQ